MFFSTFTENLPRLGEYVRMRGSDVHDVPYEVVDRLRDKDTGQVWFDLAYENRKERFKAEQLDFWPAQGDEVLIIMGPYLDWLAFQVRVAHEGMSRNRIKQIEARFKACEQTGKTTEELCQKHILEIVEGTGVNAMGGIRRPNRNLFKCPLRCLAVLQKKDRRTDSGFQQQQQLSLLEQSAA